jgi:hypothetical protein
MKLQSTGTVAGLAGAALILATIVASGSAQSTDRRATSAAADLDPSGKGHRLPAEPSARHPSRVTAVELVGLSQTTVILRDRDGTIVYRSDPVTNTTLVGKDADIPTVTIKESADSTAQRQPARRMESKEQPNTQPKRPMPVGCEGVVSVLVDQDSRRVPGLCLS